LVYSGFGSDKIVWKLAELRIYFQQQKFSPWNTVSGSIRFLQIQVFAGERASNESVVIENGYFCFFRSLSSEHFAYMATQPLRDATVDDLRDISRSLDCFTSNFSRTVCDMAKVTIDY